jgi:hypothetical protein
MAHKAYAIQYSEDLDKYESLKLYNDAVRVFTKVINASHGEKQTTKDILGSFLYDILIRNNGNTEELLLDDISPWKVIRKQVDKTKEDCAETFHVYIEEIIRQQLIEEHYEG